MGDCCHSVSNEVKTLPRRLSVCSYTSDALSRKHKNAIISSLAPQQEEEEEEQDE